ADAGRLAHAAAQVVQPRATHLAVAHHLDLVDARRVHEERALHPHSVGDAAHRDVAPQTSARDTDDQALEDLDALASALHHLGVDPHRVARTELGNRLLLLLLLELVDDVHGNLFISEWGPWRALGASGRSRRGCRRAALRGPGDRATRRAW